MERVRRLSRWERRLVKSLCRKYDLELYELMQKHPGPYVAETKRKVILELFITHSLSPQQIASILNFAHPSVIYKHIRLHFSGETI